MAGVKNESGFLLPFISFALKNYFSLHSSEVNFLPGETAGLTWPQIAIGRAFGYCEPSIFPPTVAKFISDWP